MKKNSLCFPFLILFFTCFLVNVAADNLALEVFHETGAVRLSVQYQFRESENILEPIEVGLKSQIRFTIQLCERREGLFSFLGDIILKEQTIEFVGYKDFFEKVFVLEDGAGKKIHYKTERDFLNAFRTLDRLPLDSFLDGANRSSSFLRVHVMVYQVKLITPLTLIYFVSKTGIFESDWVELKLP